LGTSLPFSSLAAAIRSQRPRLLWLSVSHVRDEAEFVAGYRELHDTARELGTAMVVGGQALGRELRQQMSYASFCDTVRQLDDFARAFRGSESVLRDREEGAAIRPSEPNKAGEMGDGDDRSQADRSQADRSQADREREDRAATIPIRVAR